MWESDGLVPSLLDRLLAPPVDEQAAQHAFTRAPGIAPSGRAEQLVPAAFHVEQVKKYLLRDVECLLKTTRRTLGKGAADRAFAQRYPEVSHSIYCYGIRDLRAFGFSPGDEERLLEEIRQALVRFEPRLRKAEVSISGRAVNDFALEILIEGYLEVKPAPQLIRFQAKLPALTKSIELPRRPSRGGGDPYDYYLTILEVGHAGRDT